MKVYVLISSSGEYEQLLDNVEGVFESEDSAKQEGLRVARAAWKNTEFKLTDWVEWNLPCDTVRGIKIDAVFHGGLHELTVEEFETRC